MVIHASITLLLILVSLLFLHSPGTIDVPLWVRWAYSVDTYGVIAGFEINAADYPPLSSLILAGAIKLFPAIGAKDFGTTKLPILFFLFLTSFMFWLWTKDMMATAVLHFSLLLSSLALGYIDIYFAPTLILALWALKERRWLSFSLFFTISCLTKWRPLIIMPFLMIYILDNLKVEGWRPLAKVLLPAVAITAAILATLGLSPVWQSFYRREMTFRNLLVFSILGYLAYFTFNIGVHEDHLFLVAIFAIVLWWIEPTQWPIMMLLVLMFNLNMFMFYGIDGAGLGFTRVIDGIIDIALLFSVFNILFFLYYLARRREVTGSYQGFFA